MDWIALQPSREQDLPAWSWQALRFTPRVARLQEALVLEVAASCRLFGGGPALFEALVQPDPPLALAAWGRGATARLALALLRLRRAGEPVPAPWPHGLPLSVLDAAQPHLPLLARIGCRTWGQLRALPRAAVARRFGPGLLEALDAAWGDRADRHEWLVLPECFDESVELPQAATAAPELMPAAVHLLSLLQLWLRARQQGVLALEFEWTLDLRRHDGVALPEREQLPLRTAQPVQAMEHLRRLAHERLARTALAGPASRLRLRTLQTVAWRGSSAGLLPEDAVAGEALHQMIERLSARLGPGQVLVPRLHADWRPERMQSWEPAVQHLHEIGRSSKAPARTACETAPAAALYPPWLLPQPLRLAVRDERPWYQGPLQLLTRRHRVETGWWEPEGAVVRDYCVARSERAGLLWIFCEQVGAIAASARWYLHGIYA